MHSTKTSFRFVSAVFAATLGTAIAGACSSNGSVDSSGTAVGAVTSSDDSDAGNQAGGVATFTADEVTNIMRVLNQGEIDQAQVALGKDVSADVRAFAQKMVDEHGQAIADSDAGAGTDPTSDLLVHSNQLVVQDLSTQSPPAFDLAYMTAQIETHAKALSLIDKSLVPSAKADQADSGTGLVDELTKMRATVLSHLSEALTLQETIRKGGQADGGTGDGGADGGATNDGGAADGGASSDGGGTDGGATDGGGSTSDGGGTDGGGSTGDGGTSGIDASIELDGSVF